MADLDRNATLSEPVDKQLGCGRREDHGLSALRESDNRAVLGDDGVNEAEVSGCAPEVIESTTRDDGHRDAAFTNVCNRAAHFRIEHPVAGDGSVVVERENGKPHERFLGIVGLDSHCYFRSRRIPSSSSGPKGNRERPMSMVGAAWKRSAQSFSLRNGARGGMRVFTDGRSLWDLPASGTGRHSRVSFVGWNPGTTAVCNRTRPPVRIPGGFSRQV